MKYLIFFPLAILIVSCYSENSLSGDEIDEIKKEVAGTFKAYFEGIKENGLDYGTGYLYQSDQFFWVPPGYHTPISYDSVVRIHSAKSRMFTSIQFKWKELRIIPLTRELTNYTGIVHGNFTTTDGHQNLVSLIETGIMISVDGKWKFFSGQSALLDNSGAFLVDKL